MCTLCDYVSCLKRARVFVACVCPAVDSCGTMCRYRATWKGRGVAVKAMKMPEQPEGNASSHAMECWQQKLREITEDFVSEVQVLAPLNHINLVRLLGYPHKPPCCYLCIVKRPVVELGICKPWARALSRTERARTGTRQTPSTSYRSSCWARPWTSSCTSNTGGPHHSRCATDAPHSA